MNKIINNSKTENCKSRKIDFTFISAHYASFMQIGPFVRGVCILVIGTGPQTEFCLIQNQSQKCNSQSKFGLIYVINLCQILFLAKKCGPMISLFRHLTFFLARLKLFHQQNRNPIEGPPYTPQYHIGVMYDRGLVSPIPLCTILE